MKRCFKCGIEKLPSEFYRHSGMAGGLVGKCKVCTRTDVKAHRVANLDRIRAYDRARAVQPHRIAAATRVTRAWRQKYRDRLAAHNKAARAGLEAPERCEGCNKAVKVEKHHPDYSKPLLVVWFCKPCHAIADKIRRRLEAC